MKSYILAITLSMFISALYAFQNLGNVAVRFLMFEWVFPQGVWDVLLFAGGAVLMWIFSLFSSAETRSKYKKIISEKDEKISAVEKEKAALLESLSSSRRDIERQAVELTAKEEKPSGGTAETAGATD